MIEVLEVLVYELAKVTPCDTHSTLSVVSSELRKAGCTVTLSGKRLYAKTTSGYEIVIAVAP
jgi:hypothetical protein